MRKCLTCGATHDLSRTKWGLQCPWCVPFFRNFPWREERRRNKRRREANKRRGK